MGIWMLKILFLAVVIYVMYILMVFSWYAIYKSMEKYDERNGLSKTRNEDK